MVTNAEAVVQWYFGKAGGIYSVLHSNVKSSFIEKSKSRCLTFPNRSPGNNIFIKGKYQRLASVEGYSADFNVEEGS